MDMSFVAMPNNTKQDQKMSINRFMIRFKDFEKEFCEKKLDKKDTLRKAKTMDG